jgi:hypothetical protein
LFKTINSIRLYGVVTLCIIPGDPIRPDPTQISSYSGKFRRNPGRIPTDRNPTKNLSDPMEIIQIRPPTNLLGCSHDFECKNPLYHPITLPKSGLTMCRQCVRIIHGETKCSYDHALIGTIYTSIDELPTNYPLLMIFYDQSEVNIKH